MPGITEGCTIMPIAVGSSLMLTLAPVTTACFTEISRVFDLPLRTASLAANRWSAAIWKFVHLTGADGPCERAYDVHQAFPMRLRTSWGQDGHPNANSLGQLPSVEALQYEVQILLRHLPGHRTGRPPQGASAPRGLPDGGGGAGHGGVR